jgi:hypothetical protein
VLQHLLYTPIICMGHLPTKGARFLCCCLCCCASCLQDRTGRTALHWAAECNQIEAAQTLIDYGCNIKALEGMGRCGDVLSLSARQQAS